MQQDAKRALGSVSDVSLRTRMQGVFDEASAQIKDVDDAAMTVRAAIDSGDHDRALELADKVRVEHPRAGTLLSELPLPARLDILAADGGALSPGLAVSVDGGKVSPDSKRICRHGNRDTGFGR